MASTIYASSIPITPAFINNPVVQTVVSIALISMASSQLKREVVIDSEITSIEKIITTIRSILNAMEATTPK